MDFKQFVLKYTKKLKSIWKLGKIQRTSRITYDVSWNIILFILIIGFIGFFFIGGIGAGYFASLVKDEPIISYETMKKDINNYEETSKLYFAGNNYFGNIRSDLHREKTELDDVSKTLIHAVIATEDQNFEEHKGVVPKSIIRALIQEATNADIKTGGSTLTQQLIKNQILTNEVSFERKAKEILLALRLERFFSKDQILEAYLNIIPYGRDASGQNIAGIQTAAQGVFGVNASDLNLPQAAYLAGLPQSPSYYTPFENGGGLKDKEGLQPGVNRMKVVLKRMYEEDYIAKKEYDKALTYNITKDFTKAKVAPLDKYPYLTVTVEEKAKDILAKQLAKADGYSADDLKNDDKLSEEYEILANRDLRQKGYEIHTTINKDMYDISQKIAKEYDDYGPAKPQVIVNADGKKEKIMEPVEVGGILIENKTGKILSFIGGRDFKKSQSNHAIDTVRPNGSTMKPLLDYAPAMELGFVQPGTPIADTKRSFTYPGMPKPWSPSNYIQGNYHGIVSARRALAKSFNIPAADTYMKIINTDPAKNFLEKMGITTLTKGDHHYPALSLGQPEEGITVEENVNAFATFGNGGDFVDAYMIDKITTHDGKVIYEHEAKPVNVFSPQTSYLMVDMMRDVLSYGTAASVKPRLQSPGVDWAGKTGTSQYWNDTWFVATNPNVTFGTWMGYDHPKSLDRNRYSIRNTNLWAKLINKIAEIDPDLITPKNNFKQPNGIVSRSYCAVSGMLPSDLCKKAGLIKTDLFNAKYVPAKVDDSLIGGAATMVDGKTVAAGPDTPKEFTNGNGLSFNPDFLKRMGYDDVKALYPRIDTEKWKKIGIPNMKHGSSAVKNDNKKPSAPASVSHSGNKLTWKKQKGNIVGYRIYRANKPGDPFTLIGNTTKNSYALPNKDGVYIVKAVDYSGSESDGSKEILIGDDPKQQDKKNETPDNKQADKTADKPNSDTAENSQNPDKDNKNQ